MKYVVVSEVASTQRMDFKFKTLIEQCGIKQEECTFLTFLGAEKPEGSYSKIPAKQMKRVVPRFREELRRTEGTVLLLLGTTVLQAITGLKWNTAKTTGYVIEPEDCRQVTIKRNVQIGHYKTTRKGHYKKGDPKWKLKDVPCDPVLPKGCQWIIPGIPIEQTVNMGYKNITQFRAPFKNAVRLMAGEPLLDSRFSFEESTPLGKDWQGFVAYDLEVPRGGSTAIQQASLASNNGCWSFPWSVEAVAAYKEAMSQADLRIAHNQQFDIPILAAHDIEVPVPQMDTMLAASLLEPDLLKGLEAVAPLYLLLKPWKHISGEKGFTDPFYNAKDSFVELELAKHLHAKIKASGMEDLFFNKMMPSVPVLMDMKTRGIRVDGVFAEKWCAELETSLGANMLQWVERHPDVLPSSPHQLKDLFYKQWGYQPIRRKGDGISTDELAIRKLMAMDDKHRDDLMLLLAIKKESKLLSTFGKTVLGDDYVHPSYLPASRDTTDDKGKGLAATGRLACFDPNLQNQPKSARRLFIPDSPDMCFIEFDWSQAELRVAAALSGDTVMQAAIESEGGIHEHTMKKLGCDKTRAKNITFGSAYGGGPMKLRDELLKKGFDVSFKECKAAQTGLAKAYPVWWAWRETIKEKALSQQFLRNPFGRLRRFHGRSVANAALNFLPQSTVADMMWTVLLEVARATGIGRLTTVVHDSFLVQIAANETDAFIPEIKYRLERVFDCVADGFNCPVDVKVGKPGASWGELEKV